MSDQGNTGRQDDIPSSPSTSSLTSEEEPFDHTAQPASSAKPPVLGLRELAALRKRRKKDLTTSVAPNQIQLLGGSLKETDLMESDGVAGQDNPALSTLTREASTLPFARDVEIKGWKVVGGKMWSGGAKVGAYVVYDVHVILRDGGSLSILRRYTDFERLRTALKSTYPHLRASIPKLPGKSHMSKFDEKFLEERQPRLQRFLKTVMLHPEMGRGGMKSVIGDWVTE